MDELPEPGSGQREDAFARAVAALAHKERTAAELGAWLAERGYPLAEIEDAVDRLIAAGALDDERFAQRFAADKRELRGWGPDRIRAALSARGLGPGLIDLALAAEGDAEHLERAIGLLERRARPASDEPSRASALAYLARRGYDSELAYEAVRGFERRAA